MIRFAMSLLCLCITSTSAIPLWADDANHKGDQPPHKQLLYPSKVERIDYDVRSGDDFAISSRMATTDEFETVVAYYEKKLGRLLNPLKNRIRLSGEKTSRVDVVTEDSQPVDPDDPFLNFDTEQQRGVKLKCYVRHTGTESITLVISQAQGEACTHILLTHIQQSARNQ